MAIFDFPASTETESATQGRERFEVGIATPSEREDLYRLRHEVYALELGQHRPNGQGLLRDGLDDENVCIVARVQGRLAGFISVTLPTQGRYSIDKYFPRESLPFAVDADTYEVRLLTVIAAFRHREFASLLMYAAFRWIQAHGGARIVAIGRREVLSIYLRAGLQKTGLSTQSGAVTYDLLHGSVSDVHNHLANLRGLILRLEERVDWQFAFPFHKPAPCFHGGEFFAAIGEGFDDLSRRHQIINADVLDAWFPPAPPVLAALKEELPWLLRTSPPTQCAGLIRAIASARGVRPCQVLPGAGSSDLMFRAFGQSLSAKSRALILDPTYGEYAHLLERVIGCTVDRLTLRREENYRVGLARLAAALTDDYDLVALVNPNSPTGQHMARADLETLFRTAPARTRFWIDETYIDFVDSAESCETLAAASENVIVCKSMSKAYALSGARVAYLCAGPHQLESLRAVTPPWVVGLPSQLAAVRALENPIYYQDQWRQTRAAREALAAGLARLGWDILPGCANFILCHLPENGPDANTVLTACRLRGLHLRDAARMGSNFGNRAVRVAVKDPETNASILEILKSVLD